MSTSYYLTRENTSPLFLGKLTDTSFIWSIEPLDARQLTSLDHGSDPVVVDGAGHKYTGDDFWGLSGATGTTWDRSKIGQGFITEGAR